MPRGFLESMSDKERACSAGTPLSFGKERGGKENAGGGTGMIPPPDHPLSAPPAEKRDQRQQRCVPISVRAFRR